jgi:hypothetical protein
LKAIATSAPAEALPRLFGDLQAACAIAWARLSAPAATAPSEDRLLTMPEVARSFGITEYQARELGRKRRLPIVIVGERRVRVSARALDEWIRTQADHRLSYNRR